jgi:hypothetical protein
MWMMTRKRQSKQMNAVIMEMTVMMVETQMRTDMPASNHMVYIYVEANLITTFVDPERDVDLTIYSQNNT